jgi:hypothetical protein
MTSCLFSNHRTRHLSVGPTRAAVLLLAAVAALGLPSRTRLAAAEPPSDGNAAVTWAAPPTAEEIDRWVDELSDDSYAVRRSAADRLLAAGVAARPALLGVTNGPDPETRATARRLVALIDRTEFGRRLQAFAADTDGRLGTSLPGWETFARLVGDDARARALFVDMQRAEALLLAQVFSQSPVARDSSWEDRLSRLLRGRGMVDWRHGPSLGSCATMLFLGTLPEPVPSGPAATDLARLTEFPPIREAMQSDHHRDAVRRLVAAWIVHCANRSDDVLLQRLRLALWHEMAEAVPLAVAVASDPQYLTVPPGTRVIAILAVGKLGGSEHVDDLEPLLEDTTECMPGRPGKLAGQPATQVQIRDVALAVLLHLTGQDLQQYGFPAARPHVRYLFNSATLYLPSDAKRAIAIEKWRKWRAEHAGGEG